MMRRLALYAGLPLANMAILLVDFGGPADVEAGLPGRLANIVPLMALFYAHMQLAAHGLAVPADYGPGYLASVWPALAAFLALFWIPVAYGACRVWGWIRRLARAGGAPHRNAAVPGRRRLAVYAGLPLAGMAAFFLAAGAPAGAASQAVMWASPVAMVVLVFGVLLGDIYRAGIPDAAMAAWGLALALGFAATWIPAAHLALALWDRARAGGGARVLGRNRAAPGRRNPLQGPRPGRDYPSRPVLVPAGLATRARRRPWIRCKCVPAGGQVAIPAGCPGPRPARRSLSPPRSGCTLRCGIWSIHAPSPLPPPAAFQTGTRTCRARRGSRG